MTDKKRMPPELLAHFKEKAGEKDKDFSDVKESDKDKRKEAVKKARTRMEKTSREKRDEQKEAS